MGSTAPVEPLQSNGSTGAGGAKTKKRPDVKNFPKPGSISTIIRSYKSAVTKEARKINPDFGWQGRFHDHIIRDKNSLYRIQNYIINNPSKWA